MKITRAGVYLKPALVEAAHATVKSAEIQPYFRIKYERIMKRRGKKRAITGTKHKVSKPQASAIYSAAYSVFPSSE